MADRIPGVVKRPRDKRTGHTLFIERNPVNEAGSLSPGSPARELQEATIHLSLVLGAGSFDDASDIITHRATGGSQVH